MIELEKNSENGKDHQGKDPVKGEINYQANIWKSYLFQFFIGFHLISGILIPFFLTWGKLTFFEVMLLEGYFTLAIFAFEIPCGAISDYLSRKFSLFLAGITLALAAVVYSSIPNIFIFIIGETLFAFGVALISGTAEAILYDTLRKLEKEDEMTKFSARNQSFSLAGMMISAPLGSILALYVPLNHIFAYMFFPFIISAMIALSLDEPNHDLEKKTEKYLDVLRSGFRELKSNRILRILAYDLIMINVLAFFLVWTYQLYLEDLGVPIVFFGFVAALMTISQIFSANIIAKCGESVNNKKRLLFIYTIIPGIGLVLLSLIHLTILSVLLIIIIVGTSFTRNVLFTNGINKNIESNNRATVLSTIGMIGCLIRSIVYPILGILVMWNLDFTIMILGISIIILALLSPVKNEYLK